MDEFYPTYSSFHWRYVPALARTNSGHWNRRRETSGWGCSVFHASRL